MSILDSTLRPFVNKVRHIKEITEKPPFNFTWLYTDEQLPNIMEETKCATSRAWKTTYASLVYPENSFYIKDTYKIEFQWVGAPCIFLDVPYSRITHPETLKKFRSANHSSDLMNLATARLFMSVPDKTRYDLFQSSEFQLKSWVSALSGFYVGANAIAKITHEATPEDVITVLINSDIGFTKVDEIEMKVKFGIHVDINEISDQMVIDLI